MIEECKCEHCGDDAKYYLISDNEHFKKDMGLLDKLCDTCSVTTLFPGDVAYEISEQEYQRIKKKQRCA